MAKPGVTALLLLLAACLAAAADVDPNAVRIVCAGCASRAQQPAC